MAENRVAAFWLYVSLSLSVLFAIKLFKLRYPKHKLPPSPFSLPFIGNLHQIRGSVRHTLQSLAQKHGEVMLMQLGSVRSVVVSSADAARDVFKANDQASSGRPELSIPLRLTYGKDIGFTPYGEHWRQVRKICVLKILSTHKVLSFRSVREEEVAFMMEHIIKNSSSMVNMSEMFVSFTNTVMCRVAFGGTFGAGEHQRKFMNMIREFTSLCGYPNLADIIPSLAWLNHFNGVNKRVDKNFKEIDRFLDEAISHNIEKKGTDEEDDLVNLMLGIEEDRSLGFPVGRDTTKAIILDMFAGGTDTTSILLEWTLAELLRHPDFMQEAQKEVRDIASGRSFLKESDTKDMHLLNSVIKETLRFHPPAPILVRETTEDTKIQGFDIPAKTRLTVSVFAINRDPKMWEEPEIFRPKRFLGDDSSALPDFKGHDFHYIPFGSGRRGCPGIVFAMAETEVALANLLNAFDWFLPEGVTAKDFDMSETSGITSYRKNELLVRVKPHKM